MCFTNLHSFTTCYIARLHKLLHRYAFLSSHFPCLPSISMDSSKNNRSRFHSPPASSPSPLPSFGSRNWSSPRFEFGSGNRIFGAQSASLSSPASSKSATTGTNEFAFASALNGTKWSPIYESALPSENSGGGSRTSSFDAFLFDSMAASNKHNNNKNKGTKARTAKSGRRSGKVLSSAQDQPSSYPFQSVDHQFKDFDKFLSDNFKKSKNDDDLVHRFHNWEPLHRQTSADENFNRNDEHDRGGDDDNGGKHSSGPGIGDVASGVGASEGNSNGVVGGLGGREFSCEESLNHKEATGDFHSFSDASSIEQKSYVLGVPDSTYSVNVENAKEFRTGSIDGRFMPAMSSSYGLKNSGDHASDDFIAAGRPILGHRSTGTKESLDTKQIPSVFESNAGGKVRVDSESREDRVKTSSLVEQYISCASSGPTSPAFYRVADQGIDNQAATNELQGREGSSRTTSCEDSTLKRDKSLHSPDRSSSTVNHMFQFGADKGASKGHHTRKKKEIKNVHSHNIDSILYRAYHTGGKLSESSRCMERATENASAYYDNMPDLEKFSVLWDIPFQPGYQKQYLLHQCDQETESKDAWAADANLQIDSDQLTNEDNFYNRDSPIGGEQQVRWSGKDEGECDIPARSNTWKNSSFDKHMPNPTSENDWLNSPPEKAKADKYDNSINSSSGARVSGRNHRSRFASRSSSRQSSSASGAAKKYYQPRAEGNAKYRASDVTFESSFFAPKPFVFQTDASQGYASGSKGNLSNEKQIIEKDRIINGANDRFVESSSVPQSISVLPKQSAQSELPTVPIAVKRAESEQACESWRLRGNQAYAEGDFSKADEYYTQGISCILPSEKSESHIRALVLCYSNRAATRMAVGKFRDALSDCMQAMDIDPNFVKVQLRAASCHLALGECKLALRYFKDCSRHLNELETIDLKLASEASEGIRKAQQVDDKMDQVVNLLSAKNSEGVSHALHLVNEALSICPYSEKLFELKAQALLSLCKYEEVIQACEKGLGSVDQNHYCGKSGSENQMGNEEVYGGEYNCPTKLPFWQMTGKAKFYLGRLEEALNSLLKHEEAIAAVAMSCKERMESLAPLIATIRNLLHHKAAGNEAFQAGKYAAAEEHYTAALACNNASRPFTSVCFCNRAAASQAQGHIADAIADCNRAMALNPEYPKAISRRAKLHESIRNYGQAISDLRRLITLQESQQQKGKGGVRRLGNSGSNAQDLKEAYERLAKAEEDMKKGNSLDYYLILGVEPSSTAAVIKKSYRKAALKHHPDKAGQFLVRSDTGDDGLLKECEEVVRKDAQKLFQMIGEAYAILSDPGKRLHYDAEEELRKLRTTSTSKAEMDSESSGYQYEKGSRRHREGWDAWKDYESQYRFWQFGSDASEKDTFTHRDLKSSSDRFRRNDCDWDDI